MTAGTETGTSRAALDSRVRTAVLGAIQAEDGHWAVGSPLLDRVMEALGPVLDEAEADRAKLAEVEGMCRDVKDSAPPTVRVPIVAVERILAIISSEEEADRA